ncbi:MAG: M24 family metallopeptidase, partial [Thermoanaerobaculia bacterium]
MISDLDALMQSRGLGALIVPMHEAMHPAFRWISRGAKVTRGYAIKVAGRDPLLVSYPMERDEARATGLRTALVQDYEYDRIFRSAPTTSAAYAELFDGILRSEHATGGIAFCGNLPFHIYHGVADAMVLRGWNVYRADGEDLIQLARKRKDTWEIEAIRSVGARTEEVVDLVREVLRSGKRVRIGELKELVSFEIARRGMIEDHETILSQGADAAVPHSRGNRDALVVPSSPIVLDIFPADRESGYFFDLTRTFCVGEIPAELARIHRDVFDAFLLAGERMRPGTRASDYQDLVCQFFEAKGYATTRQNPATVHGYVHSLGHGVGLEIHENPS